MKRLPCQWSRHMHKYCHMVWSAWTRIAPHKYYEFPNMMTIANESKWIFPISIHSVCVGERAAAEKYSLKVRFFCVKRITKSVQCVRRWSFDLWNCNLKNGNFYWLDGDDSITMTNQPKLSLKMVQFDSWIEELHDKSFINQRIEWTKSLESAQMALQVKSYWTLQGNRK